MNRLTWLFQTTPHAAWVARVKGGRFEILSACAYAFIAENEAAYAVRWRSAHSLEDAQECCESLYRDASDRSSVRTVGVRGYTQNERSGNHGQ